MELHFKKVNNGIPALNVNVEAYRMLELRSLWYIV